MYDCDINYLIYFYRNAFKFLHHLFHSILFYMYDELIIELAEIITLLIGCNSTLIYIYVATVELSEEAWKNELGAVEILDDAQVFI